MKLAKFFIVGVIIGMIATPLLNTITSVINYQKIFSSAENLFQKLIAEKPEGPIVEEAKRKLDSIGLIKAPVDSSKNQIKVLTPSLQKPPPTTKNLTKKPTFPILTEMIEIENKPPKKEKVSVVKTNKIEDLLLNKTKEALIKSEEKNLFNFLTDITNGKLTYLKLDPATNEATFEVSDALSLIPGSEKGLSPEVTHVFRYRFINDKKTSTRKIILVRYDLRYYPNNQLTAKELNKTEQLRVTIKGEDKGMAYLSNNCKKTDFPWLKTVKDTKNKKGKKAKKAQNKNFQLGYNKYKNVGTAMKNLAPPNAFDIYKKIQKEILKKLPNSK